MGKSCRFWSWGTNPHPRTPILSLIPNPRTKTSSPGPPPTSLGFSPSAQNPQSATLGPQIHIPQTLFPTIPPLPILCCGIQHPQTPLGAVAGLVLTQHIPNLPSSHCCFPGFTPTPQTQGWLSFPGRNHSGIHQTPFLWDVLPSLMTALFHLAVTALK